MAFYVCLGAPTDQLEYFDTLPKGGDSTSWTINSRAAVGDEVLFYLSAPVSSLVARGTVASPPEREEDPNSDWPGHYLADVAEVRPLPRRVHIRELRAEFPEWGWLRSPIRSSPVPDSVALRLAALVEWDNQVPDSGLLPDVDAEAISAVEGRRQWVRHLRRERSPQLAQRKRAAVVAATGALACEACGFDFAAVYGELGAGFCEIHHRLALADGPEGIETRLDDLAVLCSNCHRVIHRTRPMLTPAQLRKHLRTGV